MKLKIYLIDSSLINIDDLLSSSFINEEEKSSISSCLNERAYREKATSLYLKKKYIGNYHLNEYGKPLSDKVYFNVSHSGGLVALAVSHDCPIGLDIELIKPVNESLKNHVVSKDEETYANKAYTSFVELWTNKESLLKCVGTGINKRMKDVPGLPINGTRQYEGNTYISKTFRHGNYVFSITLQSDQEFDVEIIE